MMKIPKQEKILDNYIISGVRRYTITRNLVGKYVLYELLNEEDYKRIKTEDTPIRFKNIIDKMEAEK